MTTTTHPLFAALRNLTASAALVGMVVAMAPQRAVAEDLPVCDERDPVVCELARGASDFFLQAAAPEAFVPAEAEVVEMIWLEGHAIPEWAFDDTFELEATAPEMPAWAYDATFDLDTPLADTTATTTVVSR